MPVSIGMTQQKVNVRIGYHIMPLTPWPPIMPAYIPLIAKRTRKKAFPRFRGKAAEQSEVG